MSDPERILVAGAGGAVGQSIAQLLRADGFHVIAGLRKRGGAREARLAVLGCEVRTLDLTRPDDVRACIADCHRAIFVPILSVSRTAAQYLSPAQAAVFFSSQNVTVDFNSAVYAQLRQAEAQVREAAPQAVILRPTMIYGHAQDGNLANLMRAVRRAPVLPVFGAPALQQPIFFEDLAEIAVSAVFDDGRRGQTIAAAGPDRVPMADLYRAIGVAACRRILPIAMPSNIAASVLESLEAFGVRAPLSAAQIRRAGTDKAPRPDEAVVLGSTPLQAGLQRLAASLDEAVTDA